MTAPSQARAAQSVTALATLLAALAMIGPFAVDTYLPSFPAIQADLAVSPIEAQQTLSLYLVAFAVMTLFHGTLSDSFGRRPVVLVNTGIFTLASVGCALAASFEQLVFFRMLQGASAGAGIVVGRAIIRDSFEGHAAQRLMSLVTMIFGLAPAIVSPLLAHDDLTLAAGMAAFTLVGWIAWRRYSRT